MISLNLNEVPKNEGADGVPVPEQPHEIPQEKSYQEVGQENISKMMEGAAELKKNVSEYASEKVSTARDRVVSLGSKLSGGISGLWSRAKSAAKTGAGYVAATPNMIADAAEGAAGFIAGGVNKAYEGAERVGDALVGGVEMVGKAGRTTLEISVGAAAIATRKTIEGAAAAGNAIGRGAEAALFAAADGVDALATRGKAGYEKLRGNISQAKESARTKMSEAFAAMQSRMEASRLRKLEEQQVELAEKIAADKARFIARMEAINDLRAKVAELRATGNSSSVEAVRA